MKKTRLNSLWAAIAMGSAAGLALPAVGAEVTSTFKVGGFVKLDVISSGYGDGDLAAGALGRDFYIPSSIPVGGENESRDIDFHAKSSRLNFESVMNVDGQKVVGFVEFDFLTADGNERVTNAYQPQLRHAYLTYNKWLFGQSWSTFQNVAALPEMLDFIGPTDGTVFVRQAQVRYTNGPWQFSMENPETTYGDPAAPTDDGMIPDLVGRYNFSGDWGSLSVAGIYRDLNLEAAVTAGGETYAFDENVAGYGVSVSGKFGFGDHDLRFMATTGTGLGRYVGLNTVSDVALDLANTDLETIDVMSAMISYRHVWSPKWRSNLSVAALEADHDVELTGVGVTKRTESLHVNLLHSPVTRLTLGVELTHAKRELENSLDGSMNRVQFSAKYDL